MRAPPGGNRGKELLFSTAPPRLEGAKRPRAYTLKGPQPSKAPPKGRITRGTVKRGRAGKAGEVAQDK
jgi:hypothetical protein